MPMPGLRTVSGVALVTFIITACGGAASAAPTPTAEPTYAITPAPHTSHPAEGLPPLEYLAVCESADTPGEQWPAYQPDPQWQEHVTKSHVRYRAMHSAYEPHMADYSATGAYFGYGRTLDYRGDPAIEFDERGIPMARYNGKPSYNPVTVAQFALAEHGRFLRGAGSKEDFLKAARALAELQDEDGALRFPFAYTYYLTGEVLQPGWVSGMAQGQALSVYARAYEVSNDPVFLDAGERALAFLLTWHSDGGPMETLAHLDPSLDHYLWFSEYPVSESFYTMNGFAFTLLGIYDWSEGPGASAGLATRFFRCGVRTLERVLPYYEAGGITIYDLGHVRAAVWPNIQPEYHAIHIYTVHALASVTGSSILEAREEKWRADIDGTGKGGR